MRPMATASSGSVSISEAADPPVFPAKWLFTPTELRIVEMGFIERSYRMTILITGGAGFIGGHTVLALIDRGEIPIVLDDLSNGNRAAVPSGVPFFAGDVGDIELVLRLVQNHRIDAILHFAAKIVVPESVADPLNYYLNNTVKTNALLQATVRGNVKHFVFSSTAAVYGNPSVTPV